MRDIVTNEAQTEPIQRPGPEPEGNPEDQKQTRSHYHP